MIPEECGSDKGSPQTAAAAALREIRRAGCPVAIGRGERADRLTGKT